MVCIVCKRKDGEDMLGMEGKIYNLRWTGNKNGVGGVRVMVKELCEKVVEVRIVNDRVIEVVL